MIEHVDRPHALDDALSAAAQPDSAVVAGGTDFVVQVRRRVRTWPRRLVTLERVEELRGIERHEAGMRISARTTHAELIASPDVTELATSIADGSALVGSPATRAVGTIGGNICNASPAMDLGSPLLVLEAHAELASASGGRQRVPVADLFRGSGVVGLEPGELLVAVELPPSPAQGASAYVRLGYRNAMEIAVVGAAAWLARDEDGRCSEARVALTAVAPKCVRACEVEASLTGGDLRDDALSAAAAAADGASAPIDDVRGSARYRRAMLPVVTRRALELARARLDGGPKARGAA